MLPGATFLHPAFVAVMLMCAIVACAEDITSAGKARSEVKGVPQRSFKGYSGFNSLAARCSDNAGDTLVRKPPVIEAGSPSNQ